MPLSFTHSLSSLIRRHSSSAASHRHTTPPPEYFQFPVRNSCGQPQRCSHRAGVLFSQKRGLAIEKSLQSFDVLHHEKRHVNSRRSLLLFKNNVEHMALASRNFFHRIYRQLLQLLQDPTHPTEIRNRRITSISSLRNDSMNQCP